MYCVTSGFAASKEKSSEATMQSMETLRTLVNSPKPQALT